MIQDDIKIYIYISNTLSKKYKLEEVKNKDFPKIYVN